MDKAGNCVYNTFHTADHSGAVFIGPASQVFCIRRSEDSDRQLFLFRLRFAAVFSSKRLNESYRTGGIGCIRKIL